MKIIFLQLCVITFLCSCHQESKSFIGKYQLDVSGMKNVEKGELELVGTQDDCFGKIVFYSKRKRTFEIGLKEASIDSLKFVLPGNGGYLNLALDDSIINGNFKYFGLKADLYGQKVGPPSAELEALVNLQPIGMGIISTFQEESFPSYDDKNDILYFTRDQKLFSSQWTNENWSAPIQLEISNEFNDSAPYLYNNGESLLFTSKRPIVDSARTKKNLWIAKREDDSWSKPIPLPGSVNVDTLGDYHGAISAQENIYFVSYNRNGGLGKSDIYKGVKNSERTYNVINLGNIINSDKSEADVFIDANEKYILFASTGREDSYGADDIYISFNDGRDWSQPQNLGPKVNSYAYEYGAWVDQLNGFLYFNSYRRGTSDIYRIKLEELEVFEEIN